VAARRDAEAANRAKDEFLAMLGHELRNPLAPMLTALQLMQLRGLRSREQGVLERQVMHLTRMVDDLLDVSRITRGKIDLQRRPVELWHVVRRALELAGPLLEQRDGALDLQVPRHGVGINADPDRMAQVLANLLTNAAKYSDPRSPITMTATRVGDVARIAVRDEGIGLPAEMLSRIFEPFVQQPQSLERASGGLGLGLSIVRNLVEAHGGTVWAESGGRDQGCAFIIELPAADVAAGEPRVTRKRVATIPSPSTRILVVDDNHDAATTLQSALEQLGYAVDVAFDGPSALERAELFRPSTILLDIGLPHMDGYEVARRLRARYPDEPLRLLALSGYGQERDRERSRDAGFRHHLVKPIDLSRLRDLIEEDGSA
jgi:CheY-like chemotaxis protein